MKRTTKIQKYLGIIFMLLLLLLGVLFTTIRSDTFQNKIVQVAVAKVAADMGTKISLGKFSFVWWKTAVLDNLTIYDEKGDTLIYAQKAVVSYKSINQIKNIIYLKTIKLVGAKVNFVKRNEEKDFNYLFFIRYFSPKTLRDPNKPKKTWTIIANNAILKDGQFTYNNQAYNKPSSRRFNENHIALSQINGKLANFKIINDSLHFEVKQLAVQDHSGIRIKKLSAIATVSSSVFKLEKLNAKTDYSTITDQLVFNYSSYEDFSDFINSVKINARLKNATISVQDIAYFYEPLWGNKAIFKITGETKGPVKRLDLFNLDLSYGKLTKLKGAIDFSGLPDVDNTLIDSDIKYFSSNFYELGKLFQFGTNEQLNAIGTLKYKGTLVGFTHDFVTTGNWETNLGKAYTDLKFKYTNTSSIMESSYIGLLKTEMINLKPLLGANTLSAFAGDLKINGQGLDYKTLSSKVEANVKYLTFNQKVYQNGKVDGFFNKGVFEGEANIKDENLDLSFNGIIDITHSNPTFDVKAEINYANLTYFGLDTGQSILSGNFESNISGSNIDNIIGTLDASNLVFLKAGKIYDLDTLSLKADKYDGYRSISLLSDALSLNIEGNYTIGNLPLSFNNFMSNLSPAYFKYQQTTYKDNLTFDVLINDPSLLLTFLPQEIRFSPLSLAGKYNEKTNALKLALDAEFLSFYGYKMEEVKLKLNKEIETPLLVELQSKTNRFKDSLIASMLNLDATLVDNKLGFAINAGSDSLNYNAVLKGNLLFTKDTIALQFLNSGVDVHGRKWKIAEDGKITYQKGKIAIDGLAITTGSQMLNANGTISSNPSDKLSLFFKDLEPGKLLFDLNLLTKDSLMGQANGYIEISNLYKMPLVESNFIFTNAKWNKDTIGDIRVIAKNVDKETLELTGTKILSGPLKGISLAGLLDLNSTKENFDLQLILPPSDISIVSNFLTDIISDIEGTISGKNILLKGTFKDPKLTGVLQLSNTKFKVDYLNTAYLIRQAKIVLKANEINIEPAQIYDINNQSGLVSGSVKHKSFTNWFFDLGIYDINNMQLLNTNVKQNSLFYGTGYGSGSASFKGPLEGLSIYMKVKTEKGTKVTLPLENEEAQTSVSYIKFVKEDINDRTAKKAFSNINSIIIDLEVTNDAVAEMVFDSKVGDVLSGSGSGNIKFELNKSADLFMYGTYTVNQGKYLFTAFNFVNKPFIIEQGGTIFWDGDPYNAKINLAAVYKQKASLAPLVNPADYSSNAEYERALDRFRNPVDVNSKLSLSGLLFTPKIEFDIEFPKANLVQGSNLEVTQLENRFATDPQELNKQFLSLLVFNRFLPINLAGISSLASSAPGQSASEMLSAQLNNWVSDLGVGIVDNISFDLGRDTADKRELVVSAEKTLFNERMTIRGAYGNREGSNATNVSVEYNITKDGNLQIRTNYTPFYYSTLFTNTNQQGLGGVRRGTLGIFFRHEFETIFKKK